LNDPLSEVTRKERKTLLGLSILSVFLVEAGALPSRISALGVDLAEGDQKVFMLVLLFGLVYFLSGFVIYSLSDFIVWRNKITEAYISSYEKYMSERDRYQQDHRDMELDEERRRIYHKNRVWSTLTKPVSVVRALFEFALPVAVGLLSMAVVLLNIAK